MNANDARPINPFPPHRRGLHAVRAEPYIYKDRWLEAPFGARWRELKARLRGEYANGDTLMAWEPQTITIPTGDDRENPDRQTSTRDVEALVNGPFAVHRTVHWLWGGWTVTHVPTGTAMFQCARSQAAAKRFVKTVSSLADWDSMTVDNARSLGSDVKKAIRDAMEAAS